MINNILYKISEINPPIRPKMVSSQHKSHSNITNDKGQLKAILWWPSQQQQITFRKIVQVMLALSQKAQIITNFWTSSLSIYQSFRVFDLYICVYLDLYLCVYLDLYLCVYLDLYICVHYKISISLYFRKCVSSILVKNKKQALVRRWRTKVRRSFADAIHSLIPILALILAIEDSSRFCQSHSHSLSFSLILNEREREKKDKCVWVCGCERERERERERESKRDKHFLRLISFHYQTYLSVTPKHSPNLFLIHVPTTFPSLTFVVSKWYYGTFPL